MERFSQGIKSPITKEKYARTLRRIVCDILEDILTGDFEQRVTEFVKKSKKDQEWAMTIILSISKKLRERTELLKTDKEYLNPKSFDTYFKPIKKLFDMNDVPIVWKRIYSTFPEQDNNSSGRAYTRQEIQKMLGFINGPIDRALILVAASSAIRAGGFNLTWDDIKPVYSIENKL